MQSPPNLPCLRLLEGSREEYFKISVPLNEAATRGDWKVAKTFLDKQPDLIRFAINENYETMLHIASSSESTKSVEEFVKNLVNLMEKKDLELQNRSYNTALSLAAKAGNVKMAMIMLKKNRAILEIPNVNGIMPLYTAASSAKPEMVRYLYDYSQQMSGHSWTDENWGRILKKCVEAEIFDVALKIVNDLTELTAQKRLLTDLLLVLAQKTHAFESKKLNMIFRIIKSIFYVKKRHEEKENGALHLLRIIWQKIAIMPKSEIDDIISGQPLEVKTQGGITKTYPFHVLFRAAKMGNMSFIVELLHSYPDLTWKVDDKGQTIFHIAVRHRHAKIYNLLYEIGYMKNKITSIEDNKGNNMLHLVAKSAKPKRLQNMLGLAPQMQQDVIWFKAVEQMIPPDQKQRTNINGETPRDLFTKKHKRKVTKVEDWMKDTALKCLVVAAVVAAISFVAASTRRGGFNHDTNIDIFSLKPAFNIFEISNAVTFIFSSTSLIIMFLSILAFSYAERDFLESSPNQLLFGIATLFFSIITLVVMFGASLFLGSNKYIKQPPISIATLSTMLPILLARLQFRLLGDVFYSTYQSRNLFKPNKHMLY